jgi:hypothetical protein
MSALKLKPCPLCGLPPNRFVVSDRRIEVIACQRGCKADWNSFVVHLTSEMIKGTFWQDLGAAWNTIHVWVNENGRKIVGFEDPPGFQFLPWGPYMDWSPEISDRKVRERAEAKSAEGLS